MIKKLLISLCLISPFSFAFSQEMTCINLNTGDLVKPNTSIEKSNKNTKEKCKWSDGNYTISYKIDGENGFRKNDDYKIVHQLAREYSKGIDDNLLGDSFDENYIDNVPYVISPLKNSEIFNMIFEVKRKNSSEALVYQYNPNQALIILSCTKSNINHSNEERENNINNNHVKEILKSPECQKAINILNINLTESDIDSLDSEQPSKVLLN